MDASDTAVGSYMVEHGRVHGEFACIEAGGDDCRKFVVAADDYSVALSAGELSYQLESNGERRYYVVDGEVNFYHEDTELPGIPMNNMITVEPNGQIHGPMQLNFRWMPAWWRKYE
jgi:hypothetical protein